MGGIPSSLSFIRRFDNQLIPYPTYDWHSSQGKNCDGITSVFRVAVDSCNQMWVLDTGKIGSNRLCQPQLIVFNLKNDKVVNRYRFNRNVYKENSLLITPVSLNIKKIKS